MGALKKTPLKVLKVSENAVSQGRWKVTLEPLERLEWFCPAWQQGDLRGGYPSSQATDDDPSESFFIDSEGQPFVRLKMADGTLAQRR